MRIIITPCLSGKTKSGTPECFLIAVAPYEHNVSFQSLPAGGGGAA